MIIIPKVENIEVEAYITVGMSLKEKADIKKEAVEKQWSMSKTVHNRLFPRK